MTNIIKCDSIIPDELENKILEWSKNILSIDSLIYFLENTFKINTTSDKDIISSYERDYSNIPGEAYILCRPKNNLECAIILRCCRLSKINITISAGRTNLNGSATPNGGLILSMDRRLRKKQLFYHTHFSPHSSDTGLGDILR